MPQGIVGGPRHYDGPTIGEGPWKCPACSAENAGPLDQGCRSCGSGSAKPYKVATPPPDLRLDARPAPIPQADTAAIGLGHYQIAEAWADAHPEATTIDAFIAGMRFAQTNTMMAPPVTADVAALAPEGKPRRTIIAALELFKDQVLRDAKDEIASGEWLTIDETEQLIQQLRDEEGEPR
jgi:hypothetical protein